MKINIQKGVKSFLSKEEYKYLLLLEFHKKFTKEIGKIQANLISDFEILHSDNIAKRVQKKQEIEDKVETLITKLNIPFTLFSPIYNLILYGAINDTNRPL
ncbi:MAG: hypothetical protein Q7T54_03440, partial [Candidatus Levybacteria bacterium]|nr:hypothetical protein [Candidatus Levybacteria bacterium]